MMALFLPGALDASPGIIKDTEAVERMEAAVRTYQNVTRKEFRDQLVVEHLECVRHTLGRMLVTLPGFVDAENLESAGILGLVEAANNFEPDRGVDFRTYAFHRIRGAILDELRRNCPLPQHVLQQWNRIRSVWERLGEHVGTDVLAEQTGLPESEIETILAAVRLAQPEVWLEELAHNDHGRDAGGSPEDVLDLEDQQRALADAIEQLPDQMRTVLGLYYMEDLRLAEIGEVLGLSESRISRILAQAQLRLKAILEKRLPRGH